jgi:hypothetical protein
VRLFIDDIDVTDSLDVSVCVYDSYAGGRSDTLRLVVEASAHNFSYDNILRATQSAADTGRMHLSKINTEGSITTLHAQSTPIPALAPQSRSWENVTLYQLIRDVAQSAGLALEILDIADHIYPYAIQNNESDLWFLARVLLLEGAALTVFDGKLIAYDIVTRESGQIKDTISLTDVDYEYISRRAVEKATVTSGVYSGSFEAEGVGQVADTSAPLSAGSNIDCMRWAKGLLRSKNALTDRLILKTDLETGFHPGTLTLVQPPQEKKMFVDHVRHDFGNDITKLFLRGCLEY